MQYVRFSYRLFMFFTLAFLFLLSSFFINLFTFDDVKRRKRFIKNSNFYRDLALKVFNINVNVDNFNVNPDENYLITPNHLSYLDILILKISDKIVFVSTKEVEETFLFGHLAKYGASVFIDRRTKNNIKEEVETLKKHIQQGFDLVIFLEGTTSNGDSVLPFKSAFVEIAFQLGVKILPVCIKYTKVNDEPLNEKNRDLIFYYGDMKLFNHVLNFMLKVKSVEVNVKFLEPINPSDFKDRKELSSKIHSEVLRCYTN
ncbi:MAG: 1-acyl-sn-glycerol-3-phosphate acyltransferase [Sulfurihydrogenibium sp.]|nr:MAG: 1-acyl-sn-glycerol-3-phosphate acyltransferase [Sulfurihydrogenibium sp.]